MSGMEPSELLGLFRLETDDLADPYLWSDEEFFIYLNDAQDTFVRRIGGIPDSSSALTRISFKANDTLVKFDERILRIKSVQDDQNRKITLMNVDNFENGTRLSDDYGNMADAGLDDGRTGPVRFLVTDMEPDKFRLYPLPESAGTLQLYVYRRPLTKIEDDSSILEIPEHHHLSLLDWVKYRAYMKQDVETFDVTKAADFRRAFEDYTQEAKAEKRGREDRKRTVRYGGIPML